MAKKNEWYRQCGYRKQLPEGSHKDGVSYLPEALAKVGKPVYFGKKEDRPPQDEMWIVTWVSPERRSREYIVMKQNADKHQREASDV
jgi:hypothetical protein